MKEDFVYAMSQRTIEELIEIVKFKRNNYQSQAIEAAEKELFSREFHPDQMTQIINHLIEKEKTRKDINASKVTSGIRLIHFLVDIIAFFITSLLLSFVVGLFFSSSLEVLIELIGFVLFIFSFFLYFVFMEYNFQRTVGKIFTKSKVVMKDGSKPLFNDILVRTFLRLVPFDPFSYFFTRNGFHDRLSSTIVVKMEKTYANNLAVSKKNEEI